MILYFAILVTPFSYLPASKVTQLSQATIYIVKVYIDSFKQYANHQV